MPLDDTKYHNLLLWLKERPSATLYDFEIDKYNDISDGFGKDEFRPWAEIKFKNPNHQLEALLSEFKQEYRNNRLTQGFNKIDFINDAAIELNKLLKKYITSNIGGLDVKTRTDFIITYLSRDIDELVEDVVFLNSNEEGIDEDPQKVYVCQPKILTVAQDQYDNIPALTLNKISSHFEYQEKFINKILTNITTGSSIKFKRRYEKSYNYSSFMFNTDRFGDHKENEEYIRDFFLELIEKKYVESGSLLLLYKYFFGKTAKQKVKWLQSKEKLYYLINQLIDKKLIINPLRDRSLIISKVFFKKDGSEFPPKGFYGVHLLEKDYNLDIIIGILS